MGGLESAEMKSGSGSITPPSFFHSPDFLNAAGARFPGLPVHFFSRPRICRVGNRAKCRVKTVKKGGKTELSHLARRTICQRGRPSTWNEIRPLFSLFHRLNFAAFQTVSFSLSFCSVFTVRSISARERRPLEN